MNHKTEGSSLDDEREQMHRSMLSSVSHDLKTPLASIIGSLEIYERMHDKLSEEKRSTLIRTALSESYRLDNFITNILDMAKLESNRVTIREESVSLEGVLRDTITKFGPRIDRSQVILPSAYPVSDLRTDAALFSRALSIVVDNAIKHGAYPVSFSLERSQDGKELRISISDAGSGIPKGKEEEIFSKYSRFAKSDHQHAGTGLGLSISREIMRLLGGSIMMLPSAVGAQFMISHPIR